MEKILFYIFYFVAITANVLGVITSPKEKRLLWTTLLISTFANASLTFKLIWVV